MSDVTPDQITAIIIALTSLVAAIGGVVSAVYGRQTKAHAIEASTQATEAHGEAATARKAAIYSVSQNAAIQQAMTDHCGTICPSIICPLRRKEEQTP